MPIKIAVVGLPPRGSDRHDKAKNPVNSYDFGGFFTVADGIHFDGGSSSGDALAVVGTGTTSSAYLPSGTTAGAGTLVRVLHFLRRKIALGEKWMPPADC
jgi:hypothetical protein